MLSEATIIYRTKLDADFDKATNLVGVSTAANGHNLALNWIGRPFLVEDRGIL